MASCYNVMVFLYNIYFDREDFWTQISQMNADKIKISEICVYLRPRTFGSGGSRAVTSVSGD